MQSNINEYREDVFKQEFIASELYHRIQHDYVRLSFARNYQYCYTTRQDLAELPVFSVVPFYYLEKLRKHQPSQIYDLGCGWNIFKKYIPEIIGVDPNGVYADVTDTIDADYISNHQNYFESVMSINALHYRPVSELRQIVLEFVSMIKPNGRGYLSLNLNCMIPVGSTQDYDTYIRQTLDNVNFTYEVFDVNISSINNPLDGNITMVIYKDELH